MTGAQRYGGLKPSLHWCSYMPALYTDRAISINNNTIIGDTASLTHLVPTAYLLLFQLVLIYKMECDCRVPPAQESDSLKAFNEVIESLDNAHFFI